MRRAAHPQTYRRFQSFLATGAIAVAAAAPVTAVAQTNSETNDQRTPLEAMFMACVAPDVPMSLRASVLLDAGWQEATASPETTRRLIEQRALQADRGEPKRSWTAVLDDAVSQANLLTDTTRLFVIDGEVPSLLAIRPDQTTTGITCGYSASDSTREALQLLLGVGKDPSEVAGGTLTIRAAITVRAIVQDKQARDWQIEASSHFADPAEITAETGTPFSTAFALTIALTPAES